MLISRLAPTWLIIYQQQFVWHKHFIVSIFSTTSTTVLGFCTEQGGTDKKTPFFSSPFLQVRLSFDLNRLQVLSVSYHGQNGCNELVELLFDSLKSTSRIQIFCPLQSCFLWAFFLNFKIILFCFCQLICHFWYISPIENHSVSFSHFNTILNLMAFCPIGPLSHYRAIHIFHLDI